MNYTGALPLPKGSFKTGCADVMLGHTREGSFFRLYYPADVENNEKAYGWTPWHVGDQYSQGLSTFILPSLSWMLSSLINYCAKAATIPSYLEAPIMKGTFPVVVFSHGLASHRAFYSTVCTNLASIGFIVASVEHRDGSACGTFSINEDGGEDFLLYQPIPPNEKAFPIRNKQVKVRSKECSRVLDALEKLNEGKIDAKENIYPNSTFDIESLKNKFNLSKPVLCGHSFGGSTVILALSEDQRFKLGVTMDPWMLPLKGAFEDLRDNITQPLIAILTEAFTNEPNDKGLQFLNNGKNTFVTIKGTVHQNQADTPFLTGSWLRYFSGASGTLDHVQAMDINIRLILSFIRRYVVCASSPSDEDKASTSEESLLSLQDLLLYSLPRMPISLEQLKQVFSMEKEDESQTLNSQSRL